jgi:hypothetical protein
MGQRKKNRFFFFFGEVIVHTLYWMLYEGVFSVRKQKGIMKKKSVLQKRAGRAEDKEAVHGMVSQPSHYGFMMTPS